MYRVVIAEDEMLVRNGIRHSINWCKFDMEVIADVSNGKAAFEVFEKEAPEVVITDIRMPFMDGMELISKIRQKDKNTRIIVLSCLEEFELIHKATNMGITGYIPKLTMAFEEIEAVLLRAQNELKDLNIGRKSSGALTADRDMLLEKTFKGYMFDGIFHDNEFECRLKELNARINSSRLVVCMMEVKEFYWLNDTGRDEKGSLAKFSLLNIINEIFEDHRRGEIFKDEENRFVMIFSFQDIHEDSKVREELKKILDHVVNVIDLYFSARFSFGTSGIKSGFHTLRESYQESIKAVHLAFFTDNSRIILLDSGVYRHITEYCHEAFAAVQQRLLSDGLLPAEDCAKIGNIINEETATGISGRNHVNNCLNRLVQFMPSLFGLSETGVITAILQYTDRIREAETLRNAVEVLFEYVLKLKKMHDKGTVLSREVFEAVKYIKQFFDHDITLPEVADKVGLSPSYLSGLFSREVGLSFTDYLNNIRIERAKSLLKDTNMKSYEISEKLGFSYDSYFSRTFKKITGITPNEYRHQWAVTEMEEK